MVSLKDTYVSFFLRLAHDAVRKLSKIQRKLSFLEGHRILLVLGLVRFNGDLGSDDLDVETCLLD